MEKKAIIISGIIAALLIAAFVIALLLRNASMPEPELLKIKSVEEAIEKTGLRNAAGFSPKYGNIEIDYYYKYSHCRDVLESAARNFAPYIGINLRKLDEIDGKYLAELEKSYGAKVKAPILIAKGNADFYDLSGKYIESRESFESAIIGLGACSDKILAYNFCDLLKDKPEICDKLGDKFGLMEIEAADEDAEAFQPSAADDTSVDDMVCYETCGIKYLSDGIMVLRDWQGPQCGRIKGFTGGQSKAYRRCSGSDCKDDVEDIACCSPSECVADGKCYPASSLADADLDGNIEICAFGSSGALWLDPDSSNESCIGRDFTWVECVDKDECEYGTGKYGKGGALCCGDDKGENPVKCIGKICGDDKSNDNSIACCREGSCAFNGKCYSNGCQKIRLQSGTEISAYCDGGKNLWIDLDDDHCSECMGKKSSSEGLCCGDDEGEGKYPRKFIVENLSQPLYYGCVQKKPSCVYPYLANEFPEGFYFFNDESKYLKGAFYCEEGKWNDPDAGAKYCERNGYKWDRKSFLCCGDDKNEFYIAGEDKTSACCSSKSDFVMQGRCHKTEACGDNVVGYNEECELPETENNGHCTQSAQKCIGNRTGLRDSYGNCSSGCKCIEDNFQYSCVKGSCGASCGSDSDCGPESRCDLSSCSCKPRSSCGDFVVQGYNDFGQKEECEPPSSSGSKHCAAEKCRGSKSIFMPSPGNAYGFCNGECRCDYSNLNYACKKNSCGAQCNADGTGCGAGLLCNTETCACEIPKMCGDNICESWEETSCPQDCKPAECPYKIEVKSDKKNYYLGDIVTIQISILDTNSKAISGTKFDLDTVINNVLVGSSEYVTPSIGAYLIKKKLTNNAPGGLHNYIAKAELAGCGIISDSEYINVHLSSQYIIPPILNLSRFEFFTNFSVTRDEISGDEIPRCGDGKIGYGEACEGSGICRSSKGCDYLNNVYDYMEYCTGCKCPEDNMSEQSGDAYCSNCRSCGDSEINCNEECESGTISLGMACRSGKLYERIDSCLNCRWNDDGIDSDVLIDDCECKCPKNPEANCKNGNYINYTKDYSAGCSGGKCGECSCYDQYSKDTDKDGVEDKCEPELCGNRLDDNDNGMIDEAGCIWYYCLHCGHGIFNLCSRKECSELSEGCYFAESKSILLKSILELSYPGANASTGTCRACLGATKCEDYGSDNLTCLADACGIEKCRWNGSMCCTDEDRDDVCDYEDNCPGLYNPKQENTDNDAKGDLCERCTAERLLLEPDEPKEISCGDNMDNDCDGFKDCQDSDCAGIDECCSTALDCRQNNCFIEKCESNNCVYEKRKLCDNSECREGQYCDGQGKCKAPDSSLEVCFSCITDFTMLDYGLGYGQFFNGMHANNHCCGNDANEFYIIREDNLHNLQSACCDSLDSCVDENGNCHNSNTPLNEGHQVHCSDNFWHECSGSKNALCAEAGYSYSNGRKYLTNNETGWICTYDGANFGWRKDYPVEFCNDGFDNDCDYKIDFEDEDCYNIETH